MTQKKAVDVTKIAVAFKRYLKVTVRFYHNPDLLAALKKELTLQLRTSTRERGKLVYSYDPQRLYSIKQTDKETLIVTGAGFIDRIRETLKHFDMRLVVKDSQKLPPRSALAAVPDNKFLNKLKLRKEQRDIMESIRDNDFAQYCAATGAGKTFLIKALCRYYPKARFLITTYSVKLLRDIHNALADTPGLEVSMRTGSTANKDTRIQLCSMDSLHNMHESEYDVLIIDERQEACTKKRMLSLLEVKARRCYGFSANEKDRSDNGDKFSEAVAGPFRYRATYESSVEAKSVVPIEIEWRKYHAVRIDDLSSTSPSFERIAYWRNYDRNQAVVDAIEEYSKEGQVLVYVSKVEHIYALRQMYQCPVVHAEQSADRWQELINMGLVPEGAIQPNEASIERLADNFRKKKVNVIICNSVWKRGIDFPDLRTVILAHGGAAKEEIIQAAGRVSRVADGKASGRVVDFIDDFNSSSFNRSKDRHRIYKSQNWQVVSKHKP